jgi:hypothetical protein
MSTETETTEDAELATSERGDPTRTHPAEQMFGFKYHIVSAAQNPKDVLRYEYWSKHTLVLRARDFVLCEPVDMSWAVLLRVLEVGGEGIVVESWGGKETMRYRTPAPKRGAAGTNLDDFEFKDLGPDLKWGVVRKHDGHVMTKGQPFTKEQCVQWLNQHLKTVHST